MVNSKAVSSTLTAILVTTISITLIGTTYLFSKSLLESSISQNFEVIDIINNKIILRNLGNEEIREIKVLVDGREIRSNLEEPIEPYSVGTLILDVSGITEGRHELTLVTKSMSQTFEWEIKRIEEGAVKEEKKSQETQPSVKKQALYCCCELSCDSGNCAWMPDCGYFVECPDYYCESITTTTTTTVPGQKYCVYGWSSSLCCPSCTECGVPYVSLDGTSSNGNVCCLEPCGRCYRKSDSTCESVPGRRCYHSSGSCSYNSWPSGVSNGIGCEYLDDQCDVILSGKWDLDENGCVECDSNHRQIKISKTCGSYYETSTCEYVCGADLVCDEKSPGSSCGTKACPDDFCNGTCGIGLDSCEYYDYPTSCTRTCASDCTCSDCTCSATIHDPDEASAFCVGCGQSWDIGGEYTEPSCCGDDNDEYVIQSSCDGGVSSCGSDLEACCDVDSDCVWNNVCYESGNDHDVGNSDYEYCIHNVWYDCGGSNKDGRDCPPDTNNGKEDDPMTGGTCSATKYYCSDDPGDCLSSTSNGTDYCSGDILHEYYLIDSDGDGNGDQCELKTYDCNIFQNCTDSDGNDPHTAGYVTGYDCSCSDGKCVCTSYTLYDYCSGDTCYEYVCYDDPTAQASPYHTVTYDCLSDNTCTDSDGGNAPNTGGYVTGEDCDCEDNAEPPGDRCVCTSYTRRDYCGGTDNSKGSEGAGGDGVGDVLYERLCRSPPTSYDTPWNTTSYDCRNRDTSASDSYGNDPSHTETCYGGYKGYCVDTTNDYCGRYKNPDHTDYCVDTSACFSNGGGGESSGHCQFKEYYPCDSNGNGVKDSCHCFQYYSPDYNENTCNACVGSGRWALGGDVAQNECCGDDFGEYRITAQVDVSMDGNVDGVACCDKSTDCVKGNVCYDNGTTSIDADGDGDLDYCLNGTWYDCLSDTECGLCHICESNDCAPQTGPQPGCNETVCNVDDGIGQQVCSCVNGSCEDTCGNEIRDPWENFSKCAYDFPPLVEFPLNTSYYESVLPINVSLNDTADWCGFSIDRRENKTMLNDSTTHWYSTIYDVEGVHRIYVYCNNTQGYFGVNDSVYYTSIYTTPFENLFVNKDLSFCPPQICSPGSYYLNDTDKNGVIIFNASNVKVRCNGVSIIGVRIEGSKGINLTSKNGILLENCTIRNYDIDFYLSSTQGSVFRDINFSSIRNVFLDTYSNFNYHNSTENIWINTSVNSVGEISRKIIELNEHSTKWEENGEMIADYTLGGLKGNTTYAIFDNSTYKFSKTTNGDGKLPTFSIDLGSTHILNVKEVGKLIVNLSTPSPYECNETQPCDWRVTNLYSINASVKCVNSDCGYVKGVARYNVSLYEMRPIETVNGSLPFYIISSSNPKDCGILNENQSCQLDWIVNVTTSMEEFYKIDVNFSSDWGVWNSTKFAVIRTIKPTTVSSVHFNTTTFKFNDPIKCEGTVEGSYVQSVFYEVFHVGNEDNPEYAGILDLEKDCSGTSWIEGKVCAAIIPNVRGYKGEWNCSITACDGVTNFTSYASKTAIMINTPPDKPRITKPVNGTWFNKYSSSTQVVCENTSPDVNPEDTLTFSLEWSYDKTNWNIICSNDSDGVCNLSLTDKSEGTLYLRCKAYDGYDYSNYSDYTIVNIDRTDPTCILNVSNITYSPYPLKGTYQDSFSGMSNVTYEFYNGTWNFIATVTQEPYSYDWNVPDNLENEFIDIRVTCVDRAGNDAKNDTKNVAVDVFNEIPKIWNLKIYDSYGYEINETYTGRLITITVNASDPDPVRSLSYVEGNFTWPNGTMDYSNLTRIRGKPYTHFWNYTVVYYMPPGNASVRVKVVDKDGEKNETMSWLRILETVELILENEPIDFYQAYPGREINALPNKGWPLKIGVGGNVPLNIYQNGTDLVATEGASINIANILWNQTEEGIFTSLSYALQRIVENLQPGNYQPVYYKLKVPIVEPYNYSGNLTILGKYES